MPYKQHRMCPLCDSYTLNLSDHLSKVHKLSSKERQPYLQMVSHPEEPMEKVARRKVKSMKRPAPDSGVLREQRPSSICKGQKNGQGLQTRIQRQRQQEIVR